jgi:toxin ParE1/3/4
MPRTRKPLELSPRAAREYHAELEYIAADDPHAAGLVFSRVERTLDLIERNPEMGTPGRLPGTREWPVARTSLTVIYRLRPTKIQVARILHQRRKFP